MKMGMRGGECPRNKGREGRGRRENWCVLEGPWEGVRGREDSRCDGHACLAFIPASDNSMRFYFGGVITSPLSCIRSCLGVANHLPFGGGHMTEPGRSAHHIPLDMIGSPVHSSSMLIGPKETLPFAGPIWKEKLSFRWI